MAENVLKGFKVELASVFNQLSVEDKLNYLWFVRDDENATSGKIYLGSRLYSGEATTEDFNVLKERIENLVIKIDAVDTKVDAEDIKVNALDSKIDSVNEKIDVVKEECGVIYQKIDDIYFYVYDYYQGKSLKQEQIDKVHCQKISSLLAKIHQIEIKKQRYLKEPVNIDWNYYLRKIEHQEIYDLLEKNVLLLDELLKKANQAIDRIPPILTICHRDMDSKNVLWLGDECRIIDLECLDYDSPFLEVYELALSYSGYQNGNIDYELFTDFMLSYFENGGYKILNWQDVHDCNLGMFEWLEFNLNRLIDNEDIDIAIQQVILTIKQIKYYNEIKDKLMKIIKEI